MWVYIILFMCLMLCLAVPCLRHSKAQQGTARAASCSEATTAASLEAAHMIVYLLRNVKIMSNRCLGSTQRF